MHPLRACEVLCTQTTDCLLVLCAYALQFQGMIIRGMDSAGTYWTHARTHGIDGDICIPFEHWQRAVAHALLIGKGPANVGIPHQLRTLQPLALFPVVWSASDLVSTLPVCLKHLQT